MSESLCKNCCYWAGLENGIGQCRAESPKALFPAVPMDARQIGEPKWTFGSTVWPITKATDWCGVWDEGEESDDGGGSKILGLAEN